MKISVAPITSHLIKWGRKDVNDYEWKCRKLQNIKHLLVYPAATCTLEDRRNASKSAIETVFGPRSYKYVQT